MNRLKTSETFIMTWDAYFNEKYRQIVSMGGSRSSKSYSILQLLMTELINNNGIKITVWRNTKVTCRQTVLEDFQKIIMFDKKIFKNFKENKQSGTFTYKPTGSKIVFEGVDSIGKVLGGVQDISFFNEITEFNKEVYLQITQRTSGKVICDYNPSKNFFLEDYRFDEKTTFIRSTFKNNAFCPKNIVDQLLSYEPWLPGSYEIKEAEVFYKGKPITNINQPPPHPINCKKNTANEFMWLVYGLGIGAEKPNKIYRGWRKINQEIFDELLYQNYFGMDFGTVNPTVVIEVKYDGDRGFYIREQMYKPIGTDEDALPTIIKVNVPDIIKGRSLIVADPAKKKFITMLRNANYNVEKAVKGNGSIETGIGLVQSFTIYYVPSKGLTKEYNTYSWMTDRKGNLLDDPIKKDDHLMDALRYIISYLYEWLCIEI